MTQRLSQGTILQLLRVLQPLIAAVHDARTRYHDCSHLRPRRLASLARFLKELAALPHTSDYAPFEGQLKRRLVRAQHRLHGIQREDGFPCFALAKELPSCYQEAVLAFDAKARLMLRRLADVDGSPARAPLLPVQNRVRSIR